MVKNMEFVPTGVVAMLNKQIVTPYYENERVDELLKAYPDQTTREMAVNMFMLGYIEGKRAERARRKAFISKTNEYPKRYQINVTK